MDIEQLPPNKPNFLLIVLMSVGVLLLLFVVAYFTVRWDGQHLTFRHHSAEPHSQVIMPREAGSLPGLLSA